MKVPAHPLFEELRLLPLEQGEYAIFGSGPLWIRGIRPSKDLDVLVRGNAWHWAQANGVRGIKYGCLEYASFSNGQIELYNGWYPGEWDIDALIEGAETIDGLPFVKLEEVVRWKKRMDREKDQRDLALIEAYIHNQAL